MSVLPGGAADKLGNRYEGRWTVLQMLHVVAGDFSSIRIEPPGAEGEGIEFWLRKGDRNQYHQVKRQLSGRGVWSLSTLKAKGVLSAFSDRLADPDSDCIFVSTEKALALEALSDRARTASSLNEFTGTFLQVDLTERWSELKSVWNLPEDIAFDRIRRVYVKTIGDDLLADYVETKTRYLVRGNAHKVRLMLGEFALDRLHRHLGAHEICEHLRVHGHPLRNWTDDPQTLSKLQAANERYFEPLTRDAIQGALIDRPESTAAWDCLKAGEGYRLIAIAGVAGTGKSSVAAQVGGMAQRDGWPAVLGCRRGPNVKLEATKARLLQTASGSVGRRDRPRG